MDDYVRGYKYRIYPTQEQEVKFNKMFGNSRVVFNYFLSVRQKAWNEERRSVAYSETSRLLTQLKRQPEFIWLNLSDSMSLQESLRDLENGFQRFFTGDARYPKFKSKHNAKKSYRTRNQKNGIRIEGNKLHLPKIGWVKIKLSRIPDGVILNATISKTPTGKYFVSLCVREDWNNVLKRNNGGEVGVDVGIKSFYVDSNGNVVENPRTFTKFQRKLARAQRRHAHRKDGSRRKQKARAAVAVVYEKIANVRRDFLHKESTKLVSDNQVIGIEDLHVAGMLKNYKLAKHISDVSWSSFFRMLKYKSVLYGCDLVQVGRFYASSQTCSVCGEKNSQVKDLDVRAWTCPHCGAHHDRDKNAAINILRKAKDILAASKKINQIP